MPHEPYNPEEQFQLDDRQGVGVVLRQRSRGRKPPSGTKRSKPLTPTIAPPPEAMDSLARTGLLMAALRVWELKHGIHDYF